MSRRALLACLVALLLGSALVAAPGAPAVDTPPLVDLALPARVHHSSPSILDVTGDGATDLVVGDLGGNLRTVPGSLLPGPAWLRPVGAAVESTPLYAPLGPTGELHAVVGHGSTWVPDQHGGVAVVRLDGTVRCRYQTADLFDVWDHEVGARPDGWREGVMSTPALGDVDGNGTPDIVFGGWDNHIHAMDADCKPLGGFPFHNDDSVWSSPALYDVNGDGKVEILVGGASSPGGPEDWQGGVFRALSWRPFGGGYVVELWKKRIDEVIDSSPAVGDIDGDGRAEVVVGTGVFWSMSKPLPQAQQVHAWHADDGSAVSGWPQATGAQIWASPSLGDLDGDSVPEVVVGSRDGKVYAWKGSGRLLWSVVPNSSGEGGGEIISSAVIADLDGNGANDVAVGNGWAMFLLRGRDGTRLHEPIGKGTAFQNSAVVGRVGNQWVLAAAGMSPAGTGRVVVHPIPAPGTEPPWPMWRRSATRTGVATGAPVTSAVGEAPASPHPVCTADRNPPRVPSASAASGYWVGTAGGRVQAIRAPSLGSLEGTPLNAPIVAMSSTPTGGGYWMLGRDGGIFTFGDASFHGSTGAMVLNQPVVGMTPTRSGRGYWLVAGDGGIFTFGDAAFRGSAGALPLASPVVGMVRSPSGAGYWLFARDGGVFAFGGVDFWGSGVGKLTSPLADVAAHPSGRGYWMLAEDGTVLSFGDAGRFGDVPGLGLCQAAAGARIVATPSGAGYWVLGGDGRVFAFGDAVHLGDAAPDGSPQVGLAIRRVGAS